MKNWKTSLFGLGAGALNLFANGANWKQVLFSVGIAAVGGVRKGFERYRGLNPPVSDSLS
jgi:hypothetical protein